MSKKTIRKTIIILLILAVGFSLTAFLSMFFHTEAGRVLLGLLMGFLMAQLSIIISQF